jgi:pimeloyl-ACP methyl ester carboxylesterase
MRRASVPDQRIQDAIAHWASRFLAQGVDYNDFVRTTAPLERWEQWLDAWVATAEGHVHQAEEAERRGRKRTAGEAYVRAAICFHFAKFVWLVDLAKRRAVADRAVRTLYAALSLLDPTALRLEIPFSSTTMVANVRQPSSVGRHPLVLLLPGLDSTKEEFFHWENVFLARGLATLSLDGPGQGETGYATIIRADYEAAVTKTLDALAPRTDLDLNRVGAVGVSLGGYYAPRAAAFEPAIKAVASISGPYDFGECWEQLPSLTREAFLHHAGAANEVEGRAKASQLSLAGVLGQVRQPFLVVAGKQDRLIPAQQAERVAAEAPNATLAMYPEGTHVCDNIPYKCRPLVADWMVERLRESR